MASERSNKKRDPSELSSPNSKQDKPGSPSSNSEDEGLTLSKKTRHAIAGPEQPAEPFFRQMHKEMLKDLDSQIFWHAIIRNDVSTVRDILRGDYGVDSSESGCDLEQQNEKGETPLVMAARYNRLEMLKLLLDAGVNPNLANARGERPLAMAAKYNQIEALGLLLAASANPDLTNAEGETPLVIAAGYRHLEVLKRLLAAGANPNLPKSNGVTALHIAASEGFLEIVVQLIASPICDKDIPDSYNRGKTALSWAAQENHVEIVQALLEAGSNTAAMDEDGCTALIIALTRRHYDIVKRLIEHDIADTEGRELFLAAIEGRVEAVRNILAGGGNPEMTLQGWTLLCLAALGGKTEVVQTLIEAGCQVNARDPSGHNALWWAATRGSLYLEQQTVPDHGCGNSWIIEESWPNTIKVLIAHQCEITKLSISQCQYLLSVAIKENIIELVRELMFHNFPRDFRIDLTGNTPLLKAIAEGQTEAVDLLLGINQSGDASRRIIFSPWGLDATYSRLFDLRKGSLSRYDIDPVISQLFKKGCFFPEIDLKARVVFHHFFIGQRVGHESLPLPVGYRPDGTCYISDLIKGSPEGFKELLTYPQEVLKVWFFTMPISLRQEIEPKFREHQALKQSEASRSSSSSSGSAPSLAPSLPHTLLPPPSSAARTSREHGFPSCRRGGR